MEKKGLILCDSDVLIELLDRNNKKVFELAIKFGPQNLCISSISYSELVCGSLNKEHQIRLLNQLDKFILCELNLTIDGIHRELITNYALSHGLKIQDAIIAATALFYQIPLFTLNKSDYRFIKGLELAK